MLVVAGRLSPNFKQGPLNFWKTKSEGEPTGRVFDHSHTITKIVFDAYGFTYQPGLLLFQGVAESCLAIFLPALVFGNFMVLNLFLALLLNSFNCEELKSRKEVTTFHSNLLYTISYLASENHSIFCFKEISTYNI